MATNIQITKINAQRYHFDDKLIKHKMTTRSHYTRMWRGHRHWKKMMEKTTWKAWLNTANVFSKRAIHQRSGGWSVLPPGSVRARRRI